MLNSVLEGVGNTPLLHLAALDADLPGNVFVKLESRNPGGSIKDRVALHLIRCALCDGTLKPGSTVLEATSGNMGIGIALAARAMGLKAVLTMPETMSVERRRLLSAYGAELVLTPASKGVKGSIRKANELAEQLHAFVPSQFSNPYNPKSHYETTGPEIWADTDGKIDVFVAGVGTGGTISGTGRYLKEKNPNIQIVAVEPAGSPVLSDGIPGRHKIQGIGAGFIPETLDMEIYDEILTVTDDDAYQVCRELARREGVLCGISSGAALSAAKELAVKPAYQGKTIVALFPDGGERYLSSGVFDE